MGMSKRRCQDATLLKSERSSEIINTIPYVPQGIVFMVNLNANMKQNVNANMKVNANVNA